MSEIVVGDVLSWEPRLQWCGDEAGLLRPLSWAVTLHARNPALPPMRGDELILVTQQTVSELKRVERVTWADITRLLSAQPVAGLVVDEAFDDAPIPGVPLLRAANGFLTDAEPYLNRAITERRGELYRLGSDLSRAMSTALIAGADLGALLAVAGDVGRSELLLFDRSGTVLGCSRSARNDLPFPAALLDVRGTMPAHIESRSGRWLVDRIHSGTADALFLATASGESGAPETTRLVLTQSARAIETLLRSSSLRRVSVEAPSRDSLLGELLLGSVPLDRIASHARILGVDPDKSLCVALAVSSQPDALTRLRRRFNHDTRNLTTMLPTGELALIVLNDGVWAELRDAVGGVEGVGLVRSEERMSLMDIAPAVRQARTLGRLWLAGILANERLAAGDLDGASVLGLMLSILDPDSFNPGAGRLAAFVASLLGALDEHDDERNSDLIRTLEGYISAGGSTTGAAELLGVHRNTLAYRLTRIRELTGSDLDDADTRLAFGLALKIRAMQDALDE